MIIRISELRNKDVINSADGKKLGFVRDIEIDPERGGIDAIVIPGENRFFSLFGRGDELVIAWPRIAKIGVDVILVEAENKAATPAEKGRSQPGVTENPPTRVNPKQEDLDFFTF